MSDATVNSRIKHNCPFCGFPKIEFEEGHVCRDGYVFFSREGFPYSGVCPNRRRRLMIESSKKDLGNAGIPEPYLRKTFEEFDPGENSESFETIKEWSRNPIQWVYLFGNVGTGKTHLACAAVQSAIMRGRRGYAASAPDIIWQSQPSIPGADDMITKLMVAPVLGLDDLGAHRDTSFAVEVIFRILNRRYMERKATIITSNWTLQDMAGMGIEWKRIADRILELCKPDRIIRLKGESRR